MITITTKNGQIYYELDNGESSYSLSEDLLCEDGDETVDNFDVYCANRRYKEFKK